MKNINDYLMYLLGVIVLASFFWLFYYKDKVKSLKTELNEYTTTVENLRTDIKKYSIRDSLQVAEIGVQTIRMGELKRHYQDLLTLVDDLKLKNKKLNSVLLTKNKTINKLKGTFKDSIIIIDRKIIDTLKCINIINKWFEMSGCIDKNNDFDGNYVNYDSITVIETTKFKRFLGFLWRTKKVKNKEINLINHNPHTQIKDVEFLEIKK